MISIEIRTAGVSPRRENQSHLYPSQNRGRQPAPSENSSFPGSQGEDPDHPGFRYASSGALHRRPRCGLNGSGLLFGPLIPLESFKNHKRALRGLTPRFCGWPRLQFSALLRGSLCPYNADFRCQLMAAGPCAAASLGSASPREGCQTADRLSARGARENGPGRLSPAIRTSDLSRPGRCR